MALCDLGGLFRAYGQELLRFLVRRGASRETAADIVQESFERMLRTAPALDAGDGRAYLFRTAANLAADQGRRTRLAPLAGDGEAILSGVADPAPSPEASLLSRDELRRLAAAIDTLPPRARAVFLMARIDGLTFVEIGRRLGISPKTAFSHLTHALELLRARMAGPDGNGGAP